MSDKAQRLEAVAEEIRGHRPCGFECCEAAQNLVPGEGDADAAVAVVGEAPGAGEDRQGRPFVGQAGRMLTALLETAGLEREDVFITNIVKGRPPGNRDPRADEVAHSWPWLETQMAIVEPELVVPLGRHALRRFAPDLKIGEVHGEAVAAGGWRLFPLYHPAAALHNRALQATLEEDARRLGEHLGRPAHR
jgi:uracil-DNA glycosylase